jgi:hypothetical protein
MINILTNAQASRRVFVGLPILASFQWWRRSQIWSLRPSRGRVRSTRHRFPMSGIGRHGRWRVSTMRHSIIADRRGEAAETAFSTRTSFGGTEAPRQPARRRCPITRWCRITAPLAVTRMDWIMGWASFVRMPDLARSSLITTPCVSRLTYHGSLPESCWMEKVCNAMSGPPVRRSTRQSHLADRSGSRKTTAIPVLAESSRERVAARRSAAMSICERVAGLM